MSKPQAQRVGTSRARKQVVFYRSLTVAARQQPCHLDAVCSSHWLFRLARLTLCVPKGDGGLFIGWSWRMKLAVSTWSLNRWRREQGKSLTDAIDAIADLGAPAVEFAFTDHDEALNTVAGAAKLRRRAEKHGLAIAGYCTGAEFLRPAAEQRKVVELLRQRIDVAVELGAPTMRHDVTRGFGDHSKGLPGPQTFARALKVVVRPFANWRITARVRASSLRWKTTASSCRKRGGWRSCSKRSTTPTSG